MRHLFVIAMGSTLARPLGQGRKQGTRPATECLVEVSLSVPRAPRMPWVRKVAEAGAEVVLASPGAVEIALCEAGKPAPVLAL